MNMLILTTLIIAASVRHALSFIFVYESPKICIPGSSFLYDNKICKCNSEGTEIACNRRVYSSVTPPLHAGLLQNVTTECVPTRFFDFECKKCLCDESGKYATCVRGGCGAYDFGSVSENRCLPGSVFTVDNCNGCICGEDGKAACTKLNCNLQDTQTPHCVPNTSGFLINCNYGYCTSKGKIFSNKMGCGPLEFQHKNLLNITTECEPKSIFDRNCHKCVCGNGGNYAMCHGVQCSSSTFDKTMDTKENCTPGIIFGDKCNVCVCGNNGKGACTKLDCNIHYNSQ